MQKKHNIPEYSITEFNNIFKEIIETNFSYVRIRGEISEIKTASKGQIYLTLKDDKSILSGVIWSSKINNLSFKPEEGIEVVVIGKITTWSRYKTTYQIDIDKLEISGEGSLLKIIEDRKKRLFSKGYFDVKNKKKIPFLPNKIGIITSPKGSVIYDMINKIKERFPTNIELWPVSVQGTDSANSIIVAIKGFNEFALNEQPDVLIIARGGGSTEDLMSFNDEELALTVFKSKIPIISAIGHETDTTIIDYISDLRMPTPTAAAEKIVPDKKELIKQIHYIDGRLLFSIKGIFEKYTGRLSHLSKFIRSPEKVVLNYKDKLQRILKEFNIYNNSIIEKKFEILQQLAINISSLESQINLNLIQLQNYLKIIKNQINKKIDLHINNFNKMKRLLKSNFIDNNLRKGYVLLKRSNNNILKKSHDLKKRDEIGIKFIDAQVKVKVQRS